MKKIYVITGNAGKAMEYKSILGERAEIKDMDLLEIQEIDPVKIITHKAKLAYEVIQEPVVVEDVSLIFTAISPLPGTFIKWFLKTLEPKGLIILLNSYTDKSAKAICTIGLYDGKELKIVSGQVSGKISKEPAGENGFGWDAIFIPDGQTETYAEMSAMKKNSLSHRRIAITKLLEII